MYCKKCGRLISDNSQYCQYCGTSQVKSLNTSQKTRGKRAKYIIRQLSLGSKYIFRVALIYLAICFAIWGIAFVGHYAAFYPEEPSELVKEEFLKNYVEEFDSFGETRYRIKEIPSNLIVETQFDRTIRRSYFKTRSEAWIHPLRVEVLYKQTDAFAYRVFENSLEFIGILTCVLIIIKMIRVCSTGANKEDNE